MDAFYASVEQLDNPELKGKPIAVGGSKERGVVAAASYEARKFGVRSAMSSKLAAKICPELIFIYPRFQRYKEISIQIHEIFHRYTDLIEPLALDEAYLDVTENKLDLNSGTLIANRIKEDIRKELNLIASAGVSYNKFLAKIASDQDKPDGLFVITPENALSFIRNLPVDKIHGVGKSTADRLRELQIYSGKDLVQFDLQTLNRYFGKMGSYLYNIARGIDNRLVQSDRKRKSIAAETTFSNDIFDNASALKIARKIVETLWKRYEKFEGNGRTITLKIKYNDFTQISRSRTTILPFYNITAVETTCLDLLENILPFEKPIRLLGFQISNFEEQKVEQLSLFR